MDHGQTTRTNTPAQHIHIRALEGKLHMLSLVSKTSGMLDTFLDFCFQQLN